MIAVTHFAVRAGVFRLEDISFTAAGGEYIILMGKTGTGKTTLLEAICGLKPVHSGSIHLHGHDVTHLKPAERGIGYVPQDLALFPTLTVREHLAFALMVRRWDNIAIGRRVDELSELLSVRHLLERKPQGLSGGEAQRVALGRALAFRPAVLLLDEPLSALDDETRADMAALLHSVQKLTGVTTLHVTHSLNEAKKLADRLLILKNGKIEEASLTGEREGL
ncbi:MAG TPA: ATP-binding cassette domain-containing protein [Gemmataceae bacterium]|nr:ATP-binding cassette domain-containing protein [Gemmataceae bacterium]